VKEIGHELGVRYVLEGSLRKSGNRIRVTAQLVEAETGKHVWADRYDRDLADIFAVQDEITEAVTIAVAPVIAEAEQQRAMRRPPGSLDAWAAYQRGLWHLSKFSGEENAVAEGFFHQAIHLDPSFAGAYRGAAAQLYAAAAFQTRSLLEVQGSIETLARRAVALDSDDAEARSLLCFALFLLGDTGSALDHIERALAISPNLAIAHGILGLTLIFSGRPEAGIATVQRCLRLDPRDPMMAAYLLAVTAGHYFCGDYETAMETARRLIRSYPGYPLPYRWFAAALGQLDRTTAAREALEKAIAIAPASFEMYVRQRAAFFRPEDHAHMLEGPAQGGDAGGVSKSVNRAGGPEKAG
jgi:adenylate cyclase